MNKQAYLITSKAKIKGVPHTFHWFAYRELNDSYFDPVQYIGGYDNSEAAALSIEPSDDENAYHEAWVSAVALHEHFTEDEAIAVYEYLNEYSPIGHEAIEMKAVMVTLDSTAPSTSVSSFDKWWLWPEPPHSTAITFGDYTVKCGVYGYAVPAQVGIAESED